MSTEDTPSQSNQGTERQDTEHGDAESATSYSDIFSDRLNSSVDAYSHLLKALSNASQVQARQSMSSQDQQDAMQALSKVAEYWYSDPKRAIEIQSQLWGDYMALWQNVFERMAGKTVDPYISPESSDKRFKDPDWNENAAFDLIKQVYLATNRWAEKMVETADLDPATRKKARFYLKAMSAAAAPTNNPFTNPEVLRETLSSNGENLMRGIKMLAEDIERGNGTLKIRQTDDKAFKLGENIATTEGRVIFKNDLIELIQYKPKTAQVSAVPLLIVPPWINKYYILDLNHEKSFIRWCVERGLSVFCISWVNPSKKHASYGFEEYIDHGLYAALSAVKQATGSREVHTLGYCIGGTMMATALAYYAKNPQDVTIPATTFLTAQVDFSEAGDLQIFVDEQHIQALEKTMQQKGYLESQAMAQTFNLMRPDDLIWNYYVNTYLKGTPPRAFDILFWNSDSTRMAMKCHLYYLRNFYLENNLSRGVLKLKGEQLNLQDVTIPVYSLGTKEDHIAPAKSVFKGAKTFGGPVTFTLAGSGHIAGVINPPNKNKYQYWINFDVTQTLEEFTDQALEVPGSWWVHWLAWFKDKHTPTVPAEHHMVLYNVSSIPAPGEYVREKA